MIGPLFKWFGSKWSAAKLYPKPTHKLVIEPYAGAAGYSLNHVERSILLWDTNERLQELWPWLINEATEALVREIPLNLPEGLDIRTIGLTRGQALLLKHWQRTNNVGECWTVSAWGSKPGQWTANTRARVAEQVQAVKHWAFREPSWADVGTYFIDPPYQFNYQYKVKGFSWTELAAKVGKLSADCQVIACEATCPKTGAVPSYLPFEHFARRVTSRRAEGNHTHSNELIWSYP